MTFKTALFEASSIRPVNEAALNLLRATWTFQKLEADAAWQHKAFPISLAMQVCVDVPTTAGVIQREDAFLAYVHALSAFLVDRYPKAVRTQVLHNLTIAVMDTIKETP